MENKLYRSRRRRVLGGVAAGLGEYLNLDPILVRIILVIIALINGLGIILYIVLWIIIPEEPFERAYNMGPSSEPVDNNTDERSTGNEEQQTGKDKEQYNFADLDSKFEPKKNNSGRIFAGVILIAAGLFFLIDNLFPYFNFEDFLPVALIAVGIALIWHSLTKK